MQALYVENGELSYRSDLPMPAAGPNEALVKVLIAGICSTDLEIIKGYAGVQGILGHEFVGLVEAASDEAWVGKRVVGTINIGCRECAICLGQGPEHCPQRTVLGIINRPGVFADYVALPLANLIAVPDDVPDERAVFTEPLAAALRIREQLPVRPTARVAIVGPGRLGLLIGQVLALAGGDVTMLGRSTHSLALPQRLGLKTGMVDRGDDNSFDMVVEATGNEAGLAHALRLVRPLGVLVMKSTYAGAATVNLTKLVVGEITVVGSRCGPFEPALRLLSRGQIEVGTLIEGEYSLAEGLAAFAHAAQSGTRKVLLRPSGI
jgi:threonine dehydrogenase-like Zn-dependent dehydrogenase